MESSDFGDRAPGRLVRAAEGFWSYVPDPLPLSLNLSTLSDVLEQATLALGGLANIGHYVDNPDLLIRPFVQREAVLSSKIEGTLTDLEDLVLYDAGSNEGEKDPNGRKSQDRHEVLNYIKALYHGMDRIEEYPVNQWLIRSMHGTLMAGVRGEDKQPGEYRTVQNYIARSGQLGHEARFVPPPVLEMKAAMDDLETYMKSTVPGIPYLVQLALIHYQFETIHPFVDGNGRVGRLLIPILLARQGILTQPLLYISAYFEKNRQQYTDSMLLVSQQGAWETWIRFFLGGIREQSLDVIHRSKQLYALKREYAEKVRAGSRSSNLALMVDQLFRTPAVYLSDVTEILRLTKPGAQNIIDKLIELDIVVEVTGKKRGRVYLARGIVATYTRDIAISHMATSAEGGRAPSR